MGTQQNRNPGGNPLPPSRPPAAHGFWPDYLVGGYFDAAGNLRVEYVDREHMEPLARAMADERLSTGQVRRFFTHCRAVETLLRAHGKLPESLEKLWLDQRSNFIRLDVFAADALAKVKVPPIFHNFIRRNVSAVQTHDDFLKGFIPHFESLIGFGNAYFAKGERN